jgi:hypothetical protein
VPLLSKHHSQNSTKLLFIAQSGGGKTGALASLANAGYNLRLADIDNGADVLCNLLRNPPLRDAKPIYDPAAIERVHYVSLTEPKKILNGLAVSKDATVWPRAMKLMLGWKDDDVDYGPVTSWGPQDVLVIDSLTGLSDAAHDLILKMNGKLDAIPGSYDGRRYFQLAQDLIFSFLEMVTDVSIKCNVIVNSHITYVDEPGFVRALPDQIAPQMGFPSALGKALSPKIPRLFNTILLAKKIGDRQVIETKSANNVATKTTNPTGVKDSYPLSTGLAEYFAAVRNPTELSMKT